MISEYLKTLLGKAQDALTAYPNDPKAQEALKDIQDYITADEIGGQLIPESGTYRFSMPELKSQYPEAKIGRNKFGDFEYDWNIVPNIIQLIKQIRNTFNVGLREAKEVTEGTYFIECYLNEYDLNNFRSYLKHIGLKKYTLKRV